MKTLLFFFALFSIGLAADQGKPVLIFGYQPERTTFCRKILNPNGIRFENSAKWVHPKEYGRYSAVIHAGIVKGQKYSWAAGEETEALLQYVRSGGTVIVSGCALYDLCGTKRSLKALKNLLGFQSYDRFDTKNAEVVFTSQGKKRFPAVSFTSAGFQWPAAGTPGKLTDAEVLAEYTADGKSVRPAVLVREIGKGKVYTLTPSLHGIGRNIKKLGSADDVGNFILNEDGKRLDALYKLAHALVMSANGIWVELTDDQKSWGRVPLGTVGTLQISAEKTRKAEFNPVQTLKPAFPLAENGTPKAVIVCQNKQLKPLAVELKYHLDKITGGNFLLTDRMPASSPFIEIRKQSALPPETAIVKTEGKRVLISGGPGGVRLALFYFLEKLGCRCLWPGELGKVIPHKPTLDVPELNLNRQPVLAVRQVRPLLPRPGGRTSLGLKTVGITDAKTEKDWCANYGRKHIDAQGNSSIYAWHGQGSRSQLKWGHAFGYFWKKYGRKHPEYFALQQFGSRSQESAPDRPRLCHGNPGTAEAAAQDVIADFRNRPDMKSHSICLNDGGKTEFCMCEKCRRLDPVNSPRLARGGYSLTDRVLDFSNRIADKVTAVFPDKLLSVYIYSVYQDLPVKVKPHPALILCLTAYSYTNDTTRQKRRDEFAKWSSFGNQLFFRPNALFGFGSLLAPQNYARKMFNDLEFFKANGLAGTDYDCNENSWACKGLVYYALLKAHWNPDRLDFDALLEDYCRSGFGPAANEVRDYFLLLEKITDQAASSGKPYLVFFNEKSAAELRKLLDAASAKAVGDETVLKRIDFLRTGLTAGDYTISMHRALAAGDRKKFRSVREEARAWIRKIMFESPNAFNPGTFFRNYALTQK